MLHEGADTQPSVPAMHCQGKGTHGQVTAGYSQASAGTQLTMCSDPALQMCNPALAADMAAACYTDMATASYTLLTAYSPGANNRNLDI
jgi:hypothetical protein